MAHRYEVKCVGTWQATAYFRAGNRSLAPLTLTLFASLPAAMSVLNEANPRGVVNGYKLNKYAVGTLFIAELTEKRELSLPAPLKDLGEKWM